MTSELQEEKSTAGIWRYHPYYLPIEENFRLTLGEGGTPEVALEEIVFKREDENPTGSVKDRGMAFQVSWVWQKGIKAVAISSSGNSAISAAAYCQLAGIRLYAFVSPKINKEKLEKIESFNVKVFLTPRPVSDAVKFAKEENVFLLRSSISEEALEGYQSLAFELHKNLGRIDDLFLPVSSGTTLAGIAKGYQNLGYLPRFQVVQTTAVHPIADVFDKDYKASLTSLADALVARVTQRKEAVIGLIKESQGCGWVVNDEEIQKACFWLESHNLSTSAEGAASLAAIWKAKKKGVVLGSKIVCLLTGRSYSHG